MFGVKRRPLVAVVELNKHKTFTQDCGYSIHNNLFFY